MNKNLAWVILSLSFFISISAFSADILAMLQPAKHSQILNLPPELRQKNILHFVCDCKSMAQAERFCGSFALVHAYEEQLLYSKMKGDNPLYAVESAFAHLNIKPSNEEGITLANFIKVVRELDLQTVVLEHVNGFLIVNDIPEPIYANGRHNLAASLDILETMRKQIVLSEGEVSRSIFARYKLAGEKGEMMSHVALVNFVSEDKKVSMHIVDHLNQPLKPGSELFEFVSKLYDFFFAFSPEELALREAIYLFSERGEQQTNYKSYTLDCADESDCKEFLDRLFQAWLAKEKGQAQIKPLNDGIKALKNLARFYKGLWGREHIIAIYDAMLDSLQNNKVLDKPAILEQTKKIQEAIRKSAKEQNFFSLKDDDVSVVFERAQTMVAVLSKDVG